MNKKRRIERLEKLFHVRVESGFDVDLAFRVAGKPRSWAREEAIRRFRVAIADPRATNEQRATWTLAVTKIEEALKQQLKSEQSLQTT